MIIAVPRESDRKETRIALLPESAARLIEAGARIRIETGLGSDLGWSDEEYKKAGVETVADRKKLLSDADIVFRVRKPDADEIESYRKGSLHVGFLDPFNERALLRKFSESGVDAIAMEMIPRTTRAQKMDALSSQANLGGYVAVILAAGMSKKIFPMMTTPSGTIAPARVFVIGAGVAGLQAIATAKRLGSIVEAYDTRPVVEEQVRSLGGRFVKFDIGETGETEQGYARELTEEQLARQRESMAKHCEKSDVVITTAQVFGKKAPRIVTAEMVKRMKPGSLLVDLAVESGGNVEGARLDEVVDVNGVRIIGYANLPGRAPLNASQMYSNNLTGLILEFWDKEEKKFKMDLEDEILNGCVVVSQGEIRHEMFR